MSFESIDNTSTEVKDGLKVTETVESSRSRIESNEKVKLCDRDEENNLDMFHYVSCSEEDSDDVKKCRGIVFDGENVVMSAFPYTVELLNTDVESIRHYLDNYDMDTYRIYKSHEGTLVRLFYYKNKWYTTTHRKLDAFKSKWASRDSFGTYFKRALEVELLVNERLKSSFPTGDKSTLEKFQMLLDKNKQYMFLVLNDTYTRIVCEPLDRPCMMHVGTFENGNLLLDEDIYVQKPNELKFKSLEDLCDFVNYIDPLEYQGVLIFTPQNKQYKVSNQKYQNYFKVRGNEPSIKFRYLQVRLDKKQVDLLYYLYPNMIPMFEKYEMILREKASDIYHSYNLRFKQKQHVIVPKEEFQVIKACHSYHLENRDTNKVNLQKVIENLNKLSPVTLNRIIRKQIMVKNNPNEEDTSNNRVETPVKITNRFGGLRLEKQQTTQ